MLSTVISEAMLIPSVPRIATRANYPGGAGVGVVDSVVTAAVVVVVVAKTTGRHGPPSTIFSVNRNAYSEPAVVLAVDRVIVYQYSIRTDE
uniref:Uncharacterized protein n=1 Tax=Pristionchus pacificus TaxID=54126 RepID=A0A2A6BTQ4_PRIPA|eukprot:PDM69280.1 hypothetical protein PRIPAC_47582 [Pristionchus pacificus]